MAERGFDPVDPNTFEMNDVQPDDNDPYKYAPQDDDPIDDDDQDPLSNPSLTDITQNETSFITPEWSQASSWVESYRDSFKNNYGIDDKTFDVLRLNLNRKDGNIYYKTSQINRKDGNWLYALASIKGKGAAEFKRVVEEGQRRRQEQHPKVREQPIEPTVVDRQPITFDNPGFDDKDDDSTVTWS